MAKKTKKRLIDNQQVKEKLAKLHMLQLENLLEKLEEGLIEVQEMRLIWDMVKAHGIGMDSVEDLVQKALEDAENNPEDLILDDEWSFDNA